MRLAVIGGVLVTVALVIMRPVATDLPRNTCEAPCTIQFPQDMQEDQFRLDYSDKQLKVWRER
jgi:hypothetical protein